MGLAERRKQSEIKETDFPKWVESLNSKAGFEVNLEVDWDALLNSEFPPSKENYYGVYFKPLDGAFDSICQDDMGKGALKDGLKCIKLTNSSNEYSTSKISFQDGVLTIDHCPSTNANAYGGRRDHLIKILNEKL